MTRAGHRTFQAATGLYALWVAAVAAVFGLRDWTMLAVLIGAGLTAFTVFAVRIVRTAQADRRRRLQLITGPTPAQFAVLMRALGAGDLEHLGQDS